MPIMNLRGTVILGGTESDSHVVSLYLCALMLEDEGYRVINRGCMCSVSHLMQIDDIENTVIAHVICNQNGHALEDLRYLRKYKYGSPVILGGHYTLGCHNIEYQRQKLKECGVDIFAESFDDLKEILLAVKDEQAALHSGAIIA